MDDKEKPICEVEKTKSQCRINKEYIPLKLLYLFFIGGQSCALTYRSVFMRHLGMSTRQTGMIWTLERVISVISPPFIGAVTDKFRRPKAVLITLFIGGAITLFAMYFVPPERHVSNDIDVAQNLEGSVQVPVSMERKSEYNSTSDRLLCQPLVQLTFRILCKSNTSYIAAFNCTEASTREKYHFEKHTSLTARSISSNRTRENESSRTAQDWSISKNSSWSFYKCFPSHSESDTRFTVLYLRTVKVELAKFYLLIFNDSHDLHCSITGNFTPTSSRDFCNKAPSEDVDEYGVTFWFLIFLVFLSSFASIGIYPVVEATVLGVLGKKNRHLFGLQRLWASVGYGSAALLIGYLKDRSTEKSDGSEVSNNRAFLSMFVGALICWVCASIVSARLPIRSGRSGGRARLRDIKVILKNPKAWAFYGILLFYGIDNAIVEIYLFWLAEVKFDSPSFVLGASSFIGAALDIPFCLAAGYLVRKFGHTPLLCVGFTAMSTRTILVALVANPWQLVASESLKGITWGLTFVVICSYTSKISPKGLEASTMGITQGFLFGVAYSIGALFGGAIFQSMGGDFLFLLSGSATLVATILFGIFSFFTKHNSEEKDTEISDLQNSEKTSKSWSEEELASLGPGSQE